jgi:hypothetical protein
MNNPEATTATITEASLVLEELVSRMVEDAVRVAAVFGDERGRQHAENTAVLHALMLEQGGLSAQDAVVVAKECLARAARQLELA